MKAYVKTPEKLSGAMYRVADALAEHAPDEITIVPVEEWADLVVLHVIGWPETVAEIERLEAEGKRYAIMQYCLRSTQQPNALEWLELWRGAACVWSYYDLDAALVEDGFREQTCPWCDEELPHQGQGTGATDFPRCFYYAPLGADSRTFYPRLEVGERFAILTSGYVAESEAVAECTEAAARAGRKVFHLGPTLDCHGPHVTIRKGITDDELARVYSRCDYVAGLRRCEGFEMPAAEGMLCGARPICFDRSHYRAWFEDWAWFIPEAEPAVVTDHLEALFRSEPGTLTEEQLEAAREKFNWQTLVRGFWQRILEEA
jgi:hypothetical protein